MPRICLQSFAEFRNCYRYLRDISHSIVKGFACVQISYSWVISHFLPPTSNISYKDITR